MKLLLCLVLCLAAVPAMATAGSGKVLACGKDALTAREQGRRETLVEDLFPRAQIVEQPDGYQLTWSGDPKTYNELVEFIGLERRCCPFLDFSLRVQGPDAPAVLTLQADDDTKAFIKASGLFEGKP